MSFASTDGAASGTSGIPGPAGNGTGATPSCCPSACGAPSSPPRWASPDEGTDSAGAAPSAAASRSGDASRRSATCGVASAPSRERLRRPRADGAGCVAGNLAISSGRRNAGTGSAWTDAGTAGSAFFGAGAAGATCWRKGLRNAFRMSNQSRARAT
eukprot:10132471-Lingulodinium_polyedra.AAC.1